MGNLYKNIRQRRIQLGLSQDDLANALGYKSRSTIAKIEAGENDLTQSKIEAFAKVLKTTPATLMGIDTDTYYLNPETAKLAQEAFEDPDTRILLSAKRTLSPQSMKAVIDMVKAMRRLEHPEDHPEDFADEIYPDDDQDTYRED